MGRKNGSVWHNSSSLVTNSTQPYFGATCCLYWKYMTSWMDTSIKQTQFHWKKSTWSNMLSLLEVHDFLDGYVYQTDSISLEKVYLEQLKERQEGEDLKQPFALSNKCKLLMGMRAVHFSHADCHTVGFCDNNRPLALKWIEAFHEKCNDFINADNK